MSVLRLRAFAERSDSGKSRTILPACVCRLILRRLPRINLDYTTSPDFSLIRLLGMHLRRFVEHVCGFGQTFRRWNFSGYTARTRARWSSL
jgi:hypothetical protein